MFVLTFTIDSGYDGGLDTKMICCSQDKGLLESLSVELELCVPTYLSDEKVFRKEMTELTALKINKNDQARSRLMAEYNECVHKSAVKHFGDYVDIFKDVVYDSYIDCRTFNITEIKEIQDV